MWLSSLDLNTNTIRYYNERGHRNKMNILWFVLSCLISYKIGFLIFAYGILDLWCIKPLIIVDWNCCAKICEKEERIGEGEVGEKHVYLRIIPMKCEIWFLYNKALKRKKKNKLHWLLKNVACYQLLESYPFFLCSILPKVRGSCASLPGKKGKWNQ